MMLPADQLSRSMVSDPQRLLASVAPALSARSLKIVLHILQHAIDQAEADEMVQRNVARNKSIAVPRGRRAAPPRA
jgi:hypothetical protein